MFELPTLKTLNHKILSWLVMEIGWVQELGLRDDVERVVLVDGDNQRHILDHVLDQSPYEAEAIVLIIFIVDDVWTTFLTDVGGEDTFGPWVYVVPVEERTKDATDVELSMHAVHLHYALPPAISFVVSSQDGFSSQVCSHLRRLGRESSVVPEWSLHASTSQASVRADNVYLRDFLDFVQECCTGRDSEDVPRGVLGAMFKSRYPEGHHARIFRRLMKSAVSLGWVVDSDRVSLTKRGLAALKHRNADSRNNANFVVDALLNTSNLSLKEVNAHLRDCSSPRTSVAKLCLLREDALDLGVLFRVGGDSYRLGSP